MAEEHKENQPVGAEPVKPAVISIDLKSLRYFSVVRLLLFSPKLALLLIGARGFLFKTLLMMAFLCMIGGCALTLAKLPDYGEDISGATQFIVDTVGELSLKNSEIVWEKRDDRRALPQAIRLPHIRLDIADNFDDVKESDLAFGGDEWGVILSRDGVRQWMVGSAGGEEGGSGIVFIDCIPKSQLERLHKALVSKNADGQTAFLRRGKLAEFNSMLLMALFVALAFMHFLMTMKFLLVCGAAAGIVVLFVGGKRFFCGMNGVLALGLNMTFVPALIAFFYCMTGFASSFSMAYCVCLAGYMLYAAIEGRHGKMISVNNNTGNK